MPNTRMSDSLRTAPRPINREAVARAMRPMSQNNRMGFDERLDAMIREGNFNGMQLTGTVRQGAPDWRSDLQEKVSEQLELGRAGRGRLNKVMNVGEVVSGVGGVAAGMADTAQASSPTERNLMGALTALSIIPGMGVVTKSVKPALKNALYRSRLGPAIEAMPMDKMTGQQAASHFSKFPGGVGSDELNYTGVQGLLNQPQVTKAGLLEQYRANPLEIKDVIKGKPASADDYPIIEKDGYFRIYNKQGGMESREYLSRAEARQHLETEILPFDRGTDPTKFSDYTLPGGEDYQELLMTLPTNRFKYEKRLSEVKAAHGKPDDAVGFSNWATKQEADELTRLADKSEFSNYQSGHYYEPNVLAHSRYNTRNVDGDKTLFIEEIQSDWHQTGRNQGYKTPTGKLSAEKIDPKFGDGFVVKDENGQQLITISNPTTVSRADGSLDAVNITNSEEAIKVAQNQIDNPDVYPAMRGTLSKRVPDAPYKSTDKWQGLAFSRMVRQAADGGHDRIAWTPGQVQADRYDLSDKVESMAISPHLQGDLRTVRVRDPDGSNVLEAVVNKDGIITRGDGEGKHLSEAVGKDMAEKLLDASGNKKFSGLDLKVGGEGMKSFYDKMMVKTANKFAKKYGQKVEVKPMWTAEAYDKKALDDFTTAGGDMRAAEVEGVRTGEAQEVWSMKITPEMKKDILKGGVALSGAGVAATSLMGQDGEYY